MNPILRKELRSLLRERRGWVVPAIYATVLSAAVFSAGSTRSVDQDATAFGNAVARTVAVSQSFAVALLAPVIGAAAITGERERGTWTRLLSAPIARWRIGTGKLAATAIYVVLLLLVSLPVCALAVLFGGIDVGTLAGMYTAHMVLGLTLAALGLAISTAFHRTWVAALVALAFAGALAVFSAASMLAFSEMPVAHPIWIDLMRCLDPGFGVQLFLSGDTIEGSRRLWWLHFGAMAAIATASSAFVLARVRSMVD